MKKDTKILISLGAAFAITLGLGVYGFLWWRVNNWRTVYFEQIDCQRKLRSIAEAMIVYAYNDPNDRLPPVDKWCDLLVGLDFALPKQFLCRRSDAVMGESSFAINKHIAGKRLDNIPQDVVLLFETDHGRDPNGRNELFSNRLFCDKMPSYSTVLTKVFKDRWNQSGGLEILTTQHHKGKGCNVVFVNLEVEFVKTKDLGKLKWAAPVSKSDD